MGICKCPQRKVTNLFCFEHRVNVCDYCLITKHPKCVVQSYLAWLQDSDYDPTCTLCRQPLDQQAQVGGIDEQAPPDPDASTGAGEERHCIRLTCLHLFHWDCLDNWAQGFPRHTAPAGYRCPYCSEPIFPKPNESSLLIDQLKETLKAANWARAGIGMPLLPELERSHHHRQSPSPPHEHHHQQQQPYTITEEAQNGGVTMMQDQVYRHVPPREAEVRRFLMADSTNAGEDADDNKYKRRSATEFMGKYLKSRSLLGTRRPPASFCARGCCVFLLVCVAILCLVVLLNKFDYEPSDDDPFLNPMANPNIHVADNDWN